MSQCNRSHGSMLFYKFFLTISSQNQANVKHAYQRNSTMRSSRQKKKMEYVLKTYMM